MGNSATIATIVISSGILSLLSLLLLHFLSPEHKPAWQMVSEYALGRHKWLLTSFFIFWGINTVMAACLYFNIVSTNWAILGAILVLISGIGAIMGGLFDMRHKLHGLSFALGVPTLPLGSLLIAYNLSYQSNWLPYKNEIWISAGFVWVSLVFMMITMGLFISGLKKAGVPVGPNQEPIKEIPENVIAINGYANRLLVVVYIAFNIIIANIFLRGI